MNTTKTITTFTTRAEYLSWRTQWKQDYRQLSQDIRDIKFARWYADFARHKSSMTETQTARFQAIAKKHTGQWGFLPNHTLAEFKARATAAISERHAAKETAQASYLAAQASCVSV